jgi:hypothetical protein
VGVGKATIAGVLFLKELDHPQICLPLASSEFPRMSFVGRQRAEASKPCPECGVTSPIAGGINQVRVC